LGFGISIAYFTLLECKQMYSFFKKSRKIKNGGLEGFSNQI
jgi:hypothetical protein